jgi:hypothetical protein
MATQCKRWPNHAEWARMDALTLARQGRKALEDVLDEVNNLAQLRKMVKAIEAFREIETKLLAVGHGQKDG